MPNPGHPDISGQRFGLWTALRQSEDRLYDGVRAHECVCDCGTTRIVATNRLINGSTKSCGCMALKMSAIANRKHGLSKHRLQGTWRSMKERCYNPNAENYARYGGRGIAVCDRWRNSFEAFVLDNEALALPGLTLDRRNNSQGYSPENCRWISRIGQANNRDNNMVLTCNGRSQTCAQWAREIGMAEQVVRKRVQAGWSDEEAILTPLRPRRRPEDIPPTPQRRDSHSQITCDGRSQTYSEWADELGVDPFTLRARINAGWDDERTIRTPIRPKRKEIA